MCQIRKLHEEGKVDDMMYALACGPDERLRSVKNCSINGFHFRTKVTETYMTTQNSGVVVRGQEGGMEWYGVIKCIIKLYYISVNKEVVLFECDWFDVPAPDKNRSRGYKKDKYGIADVDTTLTSRYSDEPYILAMQAEQVCYVKSAKTPNWSSVLRMKPRNLFEMPEGNGNESSSADNDADSIVVGVENMNLEGPREDLINWRRDGLEGLSVDAAVLQEARAASMPEPDDADIIDEDDDEIDDTYIDDGFVAPLEDNDEDPF